MMEKNNDYFSNYDIISFNSNIDDYDIDFELDSENINFCRGIKA